MFKIFRCAAAAAVLPPPYSIARDGTLGGGNFARARIFMRRGACVAYIEGGGGLPFGRERERERDSIRTRRCAFGGLKKSRVVCVCVLSG